MTATPGAALRPRTALVVLVAFLAAANILRSAVVPSSFHLVLNLGIGAGAVLIAALAGLRAAELGLSPADAGAGLRLGAIAFALAGAVIVILGVSGALGDSGADISAGRMLLRSLVVIPIGTVLIEELAFRGALHGLLIEVTSLRRSFVAGALLFGLWHVVPAWRSGATSGALELGRFAGVAGTFAATTVAGVVFIWLRVRSRSLVAPALAHLATNSVTFAVAWAVR